MGDGHAEDAVRIEVHGMNRQARMPLSKLSKLSTEKTLRLARLSWLGRRECVSGGPLGEARRAMFRGVLRSCSLTVPRQDGPTVVRLSVIHYQT